MIATLHHLLYVDGPKGPTILRDKQWNAMLFEMPVGQSDDDVDVVHIPTTSPEDFQEHRLYMIPGARRKTEVTASSVNADARKLMEDAKDKAVGKRISNSVSTIARRAGIPIARIMAMRWVLTWNCPGRHEG